MENIIIIEIVDGHHQPYSEGQADKPRWKQEAYLHNGGAFPQKIKLTLDGPNMAFSIGKYVMKPSALRVGTYGDPEINNWELSKNLVPYASVNDLKKVG